MSLEDIIMSKLEEWDASNAGTTKMKGAKLTKKQVAERVDYWTDVLVDLLNQEVIKMVSHAGNRYMKFAVVRRPEDAMSIVEFVGDSDDDMYRESLYPKKYDPVYLPALINNPHGSHSSGYVYGYYRGYFIKRAPKGWPERDGYTGFLKRVKEDFERAAKSVFGANYDDFVRLEINEIYDV